MVVETANGYCINFEFHKTDTTEEIALRNINEMELGEEEQYQIKACQIILTDIFIPKKEKRAMMKVINMGSTFLEDYERELVEKGREEARKESKKEFAKKLKEDNVPIEKIIQYTGLSLNVIQNL